MTLTNPNDELVVVFESANPVELDLAKSALEDAGIQFTVPDEGRIGFGVTPIINPDYKIEVVRSSADEARGIIGELFGKGESEPAE